MRRAMPLFDFYIMVDWSGGARRRGGRSDTIWIAHGPRTADTPLTNSPNSRTDTGWATKAKWLPAHVLVLHAEIYPSVRDPLPDEIKDRGQVRAMWQWARDLDCDNLLRREFCRPIEVETGSKEDLAIQVTEGWILGCSPTVTNQ